MTLVEVGGTSYYMDDKLKQRWDKIKNGYLKKYDEDRCYVVDGRERCGKSLFTIQQASYIDPTIITDLDRICFSPEEFINAIRKTESTADQTKCVIFDEAFRGLSSRAALSKINKKIIQALMEMGQKNLVVFIVLPSFFLLDIYPAMLRSNALFHIKKDIKDRRRSYTAYNFSKKAKLYDYGVKKGWGYKIPSNFKGRYYNKYPGGDEFEAAYRKKKKDSIEVFEYEDAKAAEEGKFQKYANTLGANLSVFLSKHHNIQLRDQEKLFREALNVEWAYTYLSKIVGVARKNNQILELLNS